MRTGLTLFEPQPDAGDVPEAFPSPFDELGPHALARRAADAVRAELQAGAIAPGVSAAPLDAPGGGKMFGVLVVREPGGRWGFLRAFSGLLGGQWRVPGYCPPVFDAEARSHLEVPGEAGVKALAARAEAFEASAELTTAREAVVALTSHQAREREAMRLRHEANRRERQAERERLLGAALSEPARREALHALDQKSRGDKAEKRRSEAVWEAEQGALAPGLARLERRRRALERLRHGVSRALMRRLHDTYSIPNARGERRPLRALYASREPPSGAADCAGPKLLAEAQAHGLVPVALAEFWWGAPPASGGRVAGAFYPACRDKCGPLLPFMLEGLAVAPPRVFVPPVHAPGALSLVHEDAWLVVVDKPEGLLSVPGKGEALADSVLARLRARYPEAPGPLLVHRLDLDTSGLLVAARAPPVHALLQRQFLHRAVDKRYVAWVDGRVPADEGLIDLPLRVDLDDRPRQIHDPVHGKPALTRWRVLERRGARTRVAFFPLTGRTHQLRVHAAHPLGLGAPIVGDRLYGHEGPRLLLHAEALTFTHPGTGERVTFTRPAPF
ncbi:pseudouridine synthase [Archangium primigenium]|uniref:pseudouridine synthase n=1 Tax=[Archangium] primigenium TaxID=2792470 RepID=UPI001959994F|nr:RluA family pseudouridine synthase [Archangium primigenium]